MKVEGRSIVDSIAPPELYFWTSIVGVDSVRISRNNCVVRARQMKRISGRLLISNIDPGIELPPSIGFHSISIRFPKPYPAYERTWRSLRKRFMEKSQ